MITAPIFFLLFMVVLNLTLKITVQNGMKEIVNEKIRNIAVQSSAYDAYNYYVDNIANLENDDGSKEFSYTCFKIKGAAINETTYPKNKDPLLTDSAITVNSQTGIFLNSNEGLSDGGKNTFSSFISNESYSKLENDEKKKMFNEKYDCWSVDNIIEITVSKKLTNFNWDWALGIRINGTYYSFYETTLTQTFYYNIENVLEVGK